MAAAAERGAGDDGFDMGSAAVSAPGRFGFLGMRERAEKIGGEVKIDSKAGQGTTVRVSLDLTAIPEGAVGG